MTGHEMVAMCHRMTPRELIDFARSHEAAAEDKWLALALSLASKLELTLNEQRYGRVLGVNADADLQEAIREFQVP